MLTPPTEFSKWVNRSGSLEGTIIVIDGLDMFGNMEMNLTDGHVYNILTEAINIGQNVDFYRKSWSNVLVDVVVTSVGYKKDELAANDISMADLVYGVVGNTAEIYFCSSPNTTSLSQCLKVFSGTVKKVKQITRETSTIQLTNNESVIDLNPMQEKLETAFNPTVFSEQIQLPSETRDRKIPLVYGRFSMDSEDVLDAQATGGARKNVAKATAVPPDGSYAPPGPLPLYPIGSEVINDTTPQMRWSHTAEGRWGGQYIFQIATDVNFSSIEYTSSWQANPYDTVTSALSEGTKYWRVKARAIYFDTDLVSNTYVEGNFGTTGVFEVLLSAPDNDDDGQDDSDPIVINQRIFQNGLAKALKFSFTPKYVISDHPLHSIQENGLYFVVTGRGSLMGILNSNSYTDYSSVTGHGFPGGVIEWILSTTSSAQEEYITQRIFKLNSNREFPFNDESTSYKYAGFNSFYMHDGDFNTRGYILFSSSAAAEANVNRLILEISDKGDFYELMTEGEDNLRILLRMLNLRIEDDSGQYVTDTYKYFMNKVLIFTNSTQGLYFLNWDGNFSDFTADSFPDDQYIYSNPISVNSIGDVKRHFAIMLEPRHGQQYNILDERRMYIGEVDVLVQGIETFQKQKRYIGWAACEGREYGSWISSFSNIGKSSGELITDGASIIASMLIDVGGASVSDFDITSFEKAYNPILEMRLNIINEDTTIKKEIEGLTEQTMFCFTVTALSKYKLINMRSLSSSQPSDIETIYWDDIAAGDLKLSTTDTDNIVNKGVVKSRWWQQNEKFKDEQTYLCQESVDDFGEKEQLYSWKNINSGDLLTFLTDNVGQMMVHFFSSKYSSENDGFFSSKHREVRFTARKFRKSHLEIGDTIKFDDESVYPHITQFGEHWNVAVAGNNNHNNYTIYDIEHNSRGTRIHAMNTCEYFDLVSLVGLSNLSSKVERDIY